MEFWINAPVFGDDIDSKLLCDIAEAADELGFGAVVVPDHVLTDADAGAQGFGSILESIVTIAYLAARTTRVRFGTSVLVAPLRNPVVLAKQIASLDVLTGGRIFIGLAAGWSELEFANVGADFHTRGAYTDETIALMRHLFSGLQTPFNGRFHTLEKFLFAPLPVQGGKLLILVGGTSEATLRRAATMGDMWQSSMLELAEFAPLPRRVKELAGERMVTVGTEVRKGTDWGVRLIGEGGDELRAEVGAWRDAGCERLSIGFRPVSDFLTQMEFFAREVLPTF